MKTLCIALAASMPVPYILTAEETSDIFVVDSATPAISLLDRPGTFLGETFVFEEEHTGIVRVQVGVWEAGMGKLVLDDFPFTEYVLMISGRVTVTKTNGKPKTFAAGDTFVIPKGWSGVWDIHERMKKQVVRVGAAGQ